MSQQLLYTRVPIGRPFTDCRRVVLPEEYLELSGYQAGRLLCGVTTPEAYFRVLLSQLSGIVALLDSEPEVVCCAFSLGQQAISVSHRVIFQALAPCFDVSIREIRSPESRNARLLDVKGSRSRVLSFLQVLNLTLLFYNQYTRKVIKRLGGSRHSKFAWRDNFNAAFVRDLVCVVRSRF